MSACLFFGYQPHGGHVLQVPGGGSAWREVGEAPNYYGGAERIHLDGTLAPKKYRRTGALCWEGQGRTRETRQRLHYDSDEYPQGQFLRHVLDNGYTAIAWWDRTQGDGRGACNSTVLLKGEHTTVEMLAALAQHFPHVLENLKRAGVELVEVPGT